MPRNARMDSSLKSESVFFYENIFASCSLVSTESTTVPTLGVEVIDCYLKVWLRSVKRGEMIPVFLSLLLWLL